jgi:hypothetical protein
MRVVAVIAALCLIQIAFAVDPNQGATVLQPTPNGNSSKGVTVLSPSGTLSGACVTGSKGCAAKAQATTSDPNAPIAAPPAGMNVAIVIHPKADCGCEKDEVDCKCDQRPKYVEPEIKEPPRNCTCTSEDETCACLRTLHKKRVHELVAPEQSPNHVVPEVREKLHHIRNCADGNPCQPQPEYTQPEIKKECACANLQNVDCPCSAFRPNV